MMVNLASFDPSKYDDMRSGGVIDKGVYPAIIVASEMKNNSKGTGRYLSLEFDITDGNHKGRKVWSNLNLVNQSQTAMNIARKELATIYRAIGISNAQDSGDLHGRPLAIHVDHDEYEGKLKAVIVNYSTLAQKPQGTPVAQPEPPAAEFVGGDDIPF